MVDDNATNSEEKSYEEQEMDAAEDLNNAVSGLSFLL